MEEELIMQMKNETTIIDGKKNLTLNSSKIKYIIFNSNNRDSNKKYKNSQTNKYHKSNS